MPWRLHAMAAACHGGYSRVAAIRAWRCVRLCCVLCALAQKPLLCKVTVRWHALLGLDSTNSQPRMCLRFHRILRFDRPQWRARLCTAQESIEWCDEQAEPGAYGE